MNTSNLVRNGIAAITVLVAVASPARGQNLVERSFAAQLFEPAIGVNPLLSVETASVARHLGFQLGLMVSYQRDPLVVTSELLDANEKPVTPGYTSDVSLVANQMTTDISAALGLRYGWLKSELGVGFPIHLVAGSNVDSEGRSGGDLGGTGIGDLRLHLKLQLYRQAEDSGMAIALAPIVTIPTACVGTDCAAEGRFRGESSVTVRPRVVADYRVGSLLVAGNVGWIFREDAHVFSSSVGDRLLYGVGASYAVLRRAHLLAELYGQVGFSDDCRDVAENVVCNDGSDGINNYPLEMLLAGRYQIGNGLGVLAGAGVGLIRGLGTPQFRVLAGVRWNPNYSDRDGDGLRDVNDVCPTQPEDKDGFRDSDGCPETDNDEDLISDVVDKCPNKAEDKDGFRDNDGCPDPDNDGDGIADRVDHCPFEAENNNGFEDKDGCPDVRDSDGDGLDDKRDGCPKKAETVNGFRDNDGCPDEGDLRLVEGQIEILRPIAFRRARVKERSEQTLVQLALLLRQNKKIKLLEVRARARRTTGRKGRLWRARIETIRKYLLDQGISSERVRAGSVQKLVEAKRRGRGEILLAIIEQEAGQ